MIGWLILWVVIVCAAVAAAILKSRMQTRVGRVGNEVGPFYTRRLLSQPEQVLFFRLTKALPNHVILTRVQLSRLLKVKEGKGFQAWQGRVEPLSADFVVCQRDFSVVAVIEIEDGYRKSQERQSIEAKKNKAFQDAGIRLLRWQLSELPDDEGIKASFPSRHVLTSAASQGMRELSRGL
jgi:hypothetical protein